MVPPMKRVNLIFMLLPFLVACHAEIGDDCTYDADCSPNMDRNCDSNQPGGYCLIIGCGPDECPGEASCVEFTTPCPTGQGYGDDSEKCDLIEANRGRTYCLKHCNKDSDCRSRYVCEKPETLHATIIDFSGNETKICVPAPE